MRKTDRRFLVSPPLAAHLVAAHMAARALGQAIGGAHLLDLLGFASEIPVRAELVKQFYLAAFDPLIHVRDTAVFYSLGRDVPEPSWPTLRIENHRLVEAHQDDRQIAVDIGVEPDRIETLETMAQGRTILKTRYCTALRDRNRKQIEINIEVLEADFVGLAILEAGLPSEDYPLFVHWKRTDLFWREVTHDRSLNCLGLATMDQSQIPVLLRDIFGLRALENGHV
jgi:hypothetical protein